MPTLTTIKELLQKAAVQSTIKPASFFKTGEGNYAAHDKFLGISVPTLRTIAQQCKALPLCDIQLLLQSPFNEERLLALIILTDQYKREKSPAIKEQLFKFYLANLQYVNNWNLVDSSAHLIIGSRLLQSDKQLLITLATSNILWERRIAIVATWQFIRNHQLEWTITIATLLLNDPHDLIHKAVGWMLREAGKKDQTVLLLFLDQHAANMPRTMLRYAIEKFPEEIRTTYLKR